MRGMFTEISVKPAQSSMGDWEIYTYVPINIKRYASILLYEITATGSIIVVLKPISRER